MATPRRARYGTDPEETAAATALGHTMSKMEAVSTLFKVAERSMFRAWAIRTVICPESALSQVMPARTVVFTTTLLKRSVEVALPRTCKPRLEQRGEVEGPTPLITLDLAHQAIKMICPKMVDRGTTGRMKVPDRR